MSQQQQTLGRENSAEGRRNLAERPAAEGLDQRRTLTPLVDVYETKNEIIAFADMPGVAKDQVRVELEKGTLTIEGRRPDDGGDDDKSYNYVRAFAVSRNIDADKVSAELQHGVLKVVLPKLDHDRPRQIAVQAR
jgi:HSP20 family protein